MPNLGLGFGLKFTRWNLADVEPPPVRPAQPSDMAAVLDGVDIDLSWTDNADDETGYEVHRSATGASSGFSLLATLAANAESDTDEAPLTEGKTFWYKVRALGEEINSIFSGVASATTVLPAPSDILATAEGDAINLAWTDNATDETGFSIERSETSDSEGFTELAVVDPDTEEHDDEDLTEGKTYWYRVRALGADADSAFTEVVEDTTTLPAPSGLMATVDGEDIDLSWTINSADETGFSIERSIVGEGEDFSEIGTVAAGVSAYTDPGSGLDEWVEYFYRVRATGIDANSARSDESSATIEGESSPYEIDFVLNANSNGWATYCVAAVIDASLLTSPGSQIRLTFEAAAAEGCDLWGVSVSSQAPSGDAYDSDADLTQVLFSGVTDPGTITAGGSKVSDWMPFALDPDKNLVIAFYIDNSGSADAPKTLATLPAGVTTFYRVGVNQVMTANRSSFGSLGSMACLSLVEIQ